MRWLACSLALFIVFSVGSGCRTDYDIADVAPEEHLESEDHHDHDHDHEHENEHEHSIDEEMEEAHAEGPSGHVHGAGERNHGTQWFFNQPWAAPFIWGKLFRDALTFLFLAVGIFLVTRRRRKI
ncbi:MAG: hypothetical protein KAR40_17520 [Candidatus Sabulitectum sp.]|nr:hypothetical protein [Candidatus Sabulitectum sp.]